MIENLKLTILKRKLILNPVPMGALTQLWAGTMPEALNHNGKVRIRPMCYTVKHFADEDLVLDTMGQSGQLQERSV